MIRKAITTAALLGSLLSPLAGAASPLNTQVEISFLLGYIEGSKCEFFRNGTWYDARAAQEHLRDKYNYLVARNQIDSAEAFIALAATESSFSGQAYAVRCDHQAVVSTSQWLRDELARLRTMQ